MSEVSDIVAAAKAATDAFAAQADDLNNKITAIDTTAANEQRALTDEEEATRKALRVALDGALEVRKRVILVQNMQLNSSASVRALKDQIEAANAALAKKTNEIKKLVVVVNTISDTVAKVNTLVAQLGALAAKLPIP